MRSPVLPAPEVRYGDRGSAVVEFVLVSVLLSALFLAVVQLGVALHVRNTLTAAAAEGARYAANADRSPADGVVRTREVIRSSLSTRFGSDVRGSYTDVAGHRAVVVEVRATLPLVGFAGPPHSLVVRGHALDEERAS